MNNMKYRPRISGIEIRMIITDMDKEHYKYDGKNADSHFELRNRLYLLLFKSDRKNDERTK